MPRRRHLHARRGRHLRPPCAIRARRPSYFHRRPCRGAPRRRDHPCRTDPGGRRAGRHRLQGRCRTRSRRHGVPDRSGQPDLTRGRTIRRRAAESRCGEVVVPGPRRPAGSPPSRPDRKNHRPHPFSFRHGWRIGGTHALAEEDDHGRTARDPARRPPVAVTARGRSHRLCHGGPDAAEGRGLLCGAGAGRIRCADAHPVGDQACPGSALVRYLPAPSICESAIRTTFAQGGGTG